MKPDQWQQIKAIVEEALEIGPEHRNSFIAQRARGDEVVLREVQSLIQLEKQADRILKTSAFSDLLDNTSDDQLLAAGQTFAHYQIKQQVGEGGMGKVYLAEDTRLRRKVAIKVLPSALAADYERLFRFEQEAQAASALNHPNIITIYEIGECDGLNFIATEYIEGETLHDRLRREVLPVEAVIEIASQISSALQAAHQAGIVHRDIKPDNIMIRPDGIVKVLDFGIAKLTGEHAFNVGPEAATAKKLQTNPGIVIGTASYMSPEQARGTEIDNRTDIWSLGVVMYEMVGGRAPFKGETLTDTIVAIIEKDPPPLKSVTSRRIPGRLETVISKALQKDPSKRFQTTGEILRDLEAVRKKLEHGSALLSSIYNADPAQAAETVVLESRDKSRSKRMQKGSRSRLLVGVVTALILVISALALFKLYGSGGGATEPVRSLAVLPLKSLSSDVDYLGLGVADTIIRRLSQTGKIIVRPTNTVRHYLNEDIDTLEAARQLDVDAVLDGTIQRSDDRIRLSVNLIRVSDGVSLWTESYDAGSSDIFALQDKVANKVAVGLSLQLDPEQQAGLQKKNTSSAAAYDHYVKGVSSLDLRRFGASARPQLEATIALFRKAVDADPNFALARAQLGFCYAWMGIFVDPREDWIERARDQISIAESLDPQLAEIHMTRYMIYFSRYENFKIGDAIRELRMAQTINPGVGHDELSNLYQHLGLEDLSEYEARRALEIDPTSEYVKNTILGNYRIVKLLDKWSEANQILLNGRTKPTSWIYIVQGQLADGEKLLNEELEKDPDNPNLHLRKALLLAQKKDFAQAEQETAFVLANFPAKDLSYHHVTYDVACIYALQGKAPEAVNWLRETATTGFPSYSLFQRDPFLDPIRETSEFKEFMTEMKVSYESFRNEFD